MQPEVYTLPYCDPLKIAQRFHGLERFMWLDSVSMPHRWGRFSFLMADPFQVLITQDMHTEIDGVPQSGSPFLILQRALRRFVLTPSAHPVPFQGGAVGYWGYELGGCLEHLPTPKVDDANIADMFVGFYDVVLAYDHILQQGWLFSSGLPEQREHLRVKRAKARASVWLERLHALDEKPASSCAEDVLHRGGSSNFTPKAYQHAVDQVISHILAGDIFQANISQRFSFARGATSPSAFACYQQLRRVAQAPFASYLSCDGTVIASASPERFVSQDKGGRLQTCPIKGTCRRGEQMLDDQVLQQGLQVSAKDRAENIMIVDLLRNDLAKVSVPGSVRVDHLCEAVAFATVHHLVSTLSAQKLPDQDAVDVLMALFPGGSITGGPKVRAMEIIAALEPHRRGPYCGCIGYMSFHRTMDMAVTIRTLVITHHAMRYHAGGGVTADSDAWQEYQESRVKASVVLL